ncbi:tubulin-specific chaperone A isoform 1-T1 [Morus bassanus]
MADRRLRQIKIKTGVVRRLAKEKVMYEKEAKQQEEKIERMKAEACDDYGIKKQCPPFIRLFDCTMVFPVTCKISSKSKTAEAVNFCCEMKCCTLPEGRCKYLLDSRLQAEDYRHLCSIWNKLVQQHS